MTRTKADDVRALDLVAAYVTLDIPTLDKIVTEADEAGHLGHLVLGTFEVIEQVLEQLPRAEVVTAVEQIEAIATGKIGVEESSATTPELVVLAARLSVAHATNDGHLMAELLDQPQSITLLLDAIIGLHLHLLPALGDPEVLRALRVAALRAEIDAIDE
jgi:hypothetical protein